MTTWERRPVAVAWFVLLAASTAIWWLAMAMSDRVRSWFELREGDRDVLGSFVVADLVLIVAGSLVAAWAIHRSRPWAAAIAWFTAGGVAYATLYLVAWLASDGDGWLGLVAMLLASAGSVVAAAWATSGDRR